MDNTFTENEMRRGLAEAMGGLNAKPEDLRAVAAERQCDRADGTMHAIRDDIGNGEFDGARAHIEILKRQLADLDEKLLAAAKATA